MQYKIQPDTSQKTPACSYVRLNKYEENQNGTFITGECVSNTALIELNMIF